MGSECPFQQIINTVVMERTTFTVRTLNKPKMVQKYCFPVFLHTIQSTEPGSDIHQWTNLCTLKQLLEKLAYSIQ